MPEPRRILTLHSPIPPTVLDALLTAVETSLRRAGASRVWIDSHRSPDLLVMAEVADIPADVARGPDVGTVIPQPR